MELPVKKVSHHHLTIFYFRKDQQTLQMMDKDGHTYATGLGKEQASVYPISQHTLANGVLTLPFNDYLSWMPVVVFGYGTEVDEYHMPGRVTLTISGTMLTTADSLRALYLGMKVRLLKMKGI